MKLRERSGLSDESLESPFLESGPGLAGVNRTKGS